jgi:hypothetical protein
VPELEVEVEVDDEDEDVVVEADDDEVEVDALVAPPLPPEPACPGSIPKTRLQPTSSERPPRSATRFMAG